MVVGGQPEVAWSDVELIDLSGQGRVCAKPQDFPGAHWGSMGTYLDNIDVAIVCGGAKHGDFPATNECYSYIPVTREWAEAPSMGHSRMGAATTVYSGYWSVTGGQGSSGTSEFFNPTSCKFHHGVNLPRQRAMHNVLSLPIGMVMILGNNEETKKGYLYPSNGWHEYTDLLEARKNMQAGLIKMQDSSYAVIAAGGENMSSTEVSQLGKWSWSEGPELPHVVSHGASVQWQDSNSFIIVGGRDDSVLDTLLKFNVEDLRWDLMTEKLSTAREQFTAFLVPEEYCRTPEVGITP